MPAVEIDALRDIAALTSDPLAGTEKLLADNGSADGVVTVDQIGLRARQGVTDLVAALAAKAGVGDLPANLAADTLTLTKRATAPAAPGSGKCRLWIKDNGDSTWSLRAITGDAGEETVLFAGITASEFTDEPLGDSPVSDDGEQFGAGGYSQELGHDLDSEAWRLELESGNWQLPGGGGDVIPELMVEQKQADDSWLSVSGEPLWPGFPLILNTPGTPSRGLFRLQIFPTCVAPTPAAVLKLWQRTQN
jgi:hypothetical protein